MHMNNLSVIIKSENLKNHNLFWPTKNERKIIKQFSSRAMPSLVVVSLQLLW